VGLRLVEVVGPDEESPGFEPDTDITLVFEDGRSLIISTSEWLTFTIE
jgi:hypothetical protein